MTPSSKRFMAAVRTQKKVARNKAQRLCKTSAKHGAAVHGDRCQGCWDQKLAYERETRALAREVRAKARAEKALAAVAKKASTP